MEKVVYINNIDKLKQFVEIANNCDGDVICSKGKFVVDGKSLLGIISIDTSTGIKVEYPDNFIQMTNFIEGLTS